MSMTLAANLERICEERGLSYEGLSKAAGLSRTAVLDIIKGRSGSPRIVTVSKLAHHLGMDPFELLGGTGLGRTERRILDAFGQLSEGEQEMLLAVAEARIAGGQAAEKQAG